VADWETVRELASAFPGAEEGLTYGKPSFKVGGKLFVWMSPSGDAPPDALCVRIDLDEKPLLIASDANVFFETPHYHGHPIVLLHLDAIDRETLADRIEDSWLLRAPKRLAAAYAAGQD
jgi:hypothetical protein